MGWQWGSGEWHLLIPFTRIKATPSQRSLPTIRSIIIISIRAYSTTFIKRYFCIIVLYYNILYCIILFYFLLYYIILLGGHIGRVAWIHIMLVGVSNGTSPASVAVPQAAPKVVPPRAPKAVPQEPVIRRGQVTIFPIASAFDDFPDLLQKMCPAGPVLKNAEPQPPPDLDASWLVLAKPGWFGRIMVNVLKRWYYVWTSAMMAPSVSTISWFQPQHLGKRWKTQNPEVKWSEVKQIIHTRSFRNPQKTGHDWKAEVSVENRGFQKSINFMDFTKFNKMMMLWSFMKHPIMPHEWPPKSPTFF